MFTLIDDKSFEVTGIDTSMANAIRRVCIAEIPCIAVNFASCNYTVNTSMINEYILGQKLAAQVVKYEYALPLYENLEISLKKDNDSAGIISVYLSDCVCKNIQTGDNVPIADLFVYPTSLIAKLGYEQKIEMTGRFDKSTQKLAKNSLYSNSAGIGYHFKKDVEKINAMAKEIKDEKERELFIVEKGGRNYIKNNYVFKVETTGSLSMKELIASAFNVLIEKCKRVKDNYTITLNKTLEFVAYDFIFVDEDDTIGNLVQTFLLSDPEIKFAGYLIPHPLNNILIVRTAVNIVEKNSEDYNKEVFSRTIDKIVANIEELAESWKKI